MQRENSLPSKLPRAAIFSFFFFLIRNPDGVPAIGRGPLPNFGSVALGGFPYLLRFLFSCLFYSMSDTRSAYEGYIASDHWQKLRVLAIKAARGKCEHCKSPKNLHGHHLRYRSYYDCTIADIMVLCESCHDRWHMSHPSSLITTREFVIRFLAACHLPSGSKSKPRKLSKRRPISKKKAAKASRKEKQRIHRENLAEASKGRINCRELNVAISQFMESRRGLKDTEILIFALKDYRTRLMAGVSSPTATTC